LAGKRKEGAAHLVHGSAKKTKMFMVHDSGRQPLARASRTLPKLSSEDGLLPTPRSWRVANNLSSYNLVAPW